MKVSVIISTYNSPDWLEKVLWGYYMQQYKDFEIVIADDGSGEETRKRIVMVQKETNMEIHHIWHDDNGYQRQTILNKAILATSTPYLIFTDGDCIPRNDFVSVHVTHAEKGKFLAGEYCKLPMDLSQSINKEDIFQQRCFNFQWLFDRGLRGGPQRRRLNAKAWGKILDFVTPAAPLFKNCNSSAWKDDILAVNGYDERMKYGGADYEMGERLTNFGIKGKQLRHQAIVVHLDHDRGYKTKESIQFNLNIRKQNKQLRKTWTESGIVKENLVTKNSFG